MSAGGVDVILLCEDRQHESFARRFLKAWNVDGRRIRTILSPPAQGSAEAFVVRQYPEQLRAFRSRWHGSRDVRLIVIRDADGRSMHETRAGIESKCGAAGIDVRGPDEAVGLFVPDRTIENWIQFVVSGVCDETQRFPKDTGNESRYGNAITAFARKCKLRELPERDLFPPSLSAACTEFETRFLRG